MSRTSKNIKYLSKNIKFLRGFNKYTFEELSIKTNIPKSTLWNYENDCTKLTIQNLILLSKCYNISLEDLIFKNLESDCNRW